jgi:hypothetical protein
MEHSMVQPDEMHGQRSERDTELHDCSIPSRAVQKFHNCQGILDAYLTAQSQTGTIISSRKKGRRRRQGCGISSTFLFFIANYACLFLSCSTEQAAAGSETHSAKVTPPHVEYRAAHSHSEDIRLSMRSAVSNDGFRLITPPGILSLARNGSSLLRSGGIAGAQFDRQPVVAGVPQGYSFVTVMLENNAGCGVLHGHKTAPAIRGQAAFTDLMIDSEGRGFTLRFCAGYCVVDGVNASNATLFIISPSFGVRLGRIFTATLVSGASAGLPFATQPAVRVESLIDSLFTQIIDYQYSTIARFYAGGDLLGRKSMWFVEGQASYTDLRIDMASYNSEGVRLVFMSCPGVPDAECTEESDNAMVAVSPPFTVDHGVPWGLYVVQQPVRARSGQPIGSVCEVVVGPRCARLVSVNPPSVELRDLFGNRILSGRYVACANLTRIGSNQSVVLFIGNGSTPVEEGIATFTNISINPVAANYVLNFSVYEGDTCFRGKFMAAVASVPFEVTFADPSQLLMVNQPSVSMRTHHVYLCIYVCTYMLRTHTST